MIYLPRAAAHFYASMIPYLVLVIHGATLSKRLQVAKMTSTGKSHLSYSTTITEVIFSHLYIVTPSRVFRTCRTLLRIELQLRKAQTIDYFTSTVTNSLDLTPLTDTFMSGFDRFCRLGNQIIIKSPCLGPRLILDTS
jgi:hypothetical protein